MTLHFDTEKNTANRKISGAGRFFFIHFSIQANVLNANKNYDAFVEKKHRRSEAAINHGANAYYFEKLRLNRNIKKSSMNKTDYTLCTRVFFCLCLVIVGSLI